MNASWRMATTGLLAALSAGCASLIPTPQAGLVPRINSRVVEWQSDSDSPRRRAELRQASFQAVPTAARSNDKADVPAAFSGKSELAVDDLVDQVLARNPTLAQMTAAAQAASARYSQVTSLDDPMIGGILGPASIGSKDLDFAYRLEAAQKIPYGGKLRLKGQSAAAESAADTLRHMLSGLRRMIVSIMLMGAGSSADSARPILPTALSTSGTFRILAFCLAMIFWASDSDADGSSEGM